MSEPINDGGRAFPHLETTSMGEPFYDHLGMSLRDWFAGRALNAFIISERDSNATNWDHGFWAHHAYRCADAMLKERDKK